MAWKRIKETLWGNPNKGISGVREADPNDLTLENAYKTRWIWYHTILAIGLGFVIWLLYDINNKLGFLV